MVRLRRKWTRSSGFVLADVLVALIIAAIALGSILGGISSAAAVVTSQRSRVLNLVQQENASASSAGAILSPGE